MSSSSEEELVSEVVDSEILSAIAAAEDASGALNAIAEKTKKNGGVLSSSDCRLIISAALDSGNVDLALSVFSAMRSSFNPVVSNKAIPVQRWMWSRPDVHTYTLLVKGLATSLRVLDALKMIDSVCRVGVSPGEEVPFGKVVRCPSCMIAATVSQPQHGIQIVACSKCRYKYEFISGVILAIESEEIRISSCRTQHGCSCVEKAARIPANSEAKHSSCCSLRCGGDPVWSGKNTQVCNSNS